jgi:undecaprenol kinase
MISKFFNSFKFAFNGLRTTWREEHNFRLEIVIGLVVILFLIFFHFSFTESTLCIVAIIIVLTSEIVNTAIEDLSDMVESNQNPLIGKIKDTMAGFVLVSSIGAFILGILVFAHHFIS